MFQGLFHFQQQAVPLGGWGFALAAVSCAPVAVLKVLWGLCFKDFSTCSRELCPLGVGVLPMQQ
jgi:hypothetical protein